MPRISVVMPVYNPNKDWLKQAIESILAQTYTDFEFLILDDGSTINYDDLVQKYQKNSRGGGKIVFIKLPHQGIAKTLNTGFDRARGEFIARMDADDIALPDRFKLQTEFLDKHPECALVGSFVQVLGEKTIYKYPSELTYLDLLRGCLIAHPAVMLRREEFNRYALRYNPHYKAEDYELWSRAIKVLKLCNIQKVLLKYRVHAKSLSKNPLIISSSEKIRKNMLWFLTHNQMQMDEILKLIQKSKYTWLEKLCSFKNNTSEGKKHKVICFLGIRIKLKKKVKKPCSHGASSLPPPN